MTGGKNQRRVEQILIGVLASQAFSRPFSARKVVRTASRSISRRWSRSFRCPKRIARGLPKAMNRFFGLASWLHERSFQDFRSVAIRCRSGDYGEALDCRLQDGIDHELWQLWCWVGQDPELREQIFEYIIAKLAEDRPRV